MLEYWKKASSTVHFWFIDLNFTQRTTMTTSMIAYENLNLINSLISSKLVIVLLTEKVLYVKGWNWGTVKFCGLVLPLTLVTSNMSQCTTEVTLEFHPMPISLSWRGDSQSRAWCRGAGWSIRLVCAVLRGHNLNHWRCIFWELQCLTSLDC